MTATDAHPAGGSRTAPRAAGATGVRRAAGVLWAAALGVLLVVALLLAATAALPLAGARVMGVTSGSMAPAIRAGDAVVVVDAAPEDVRAGDVVTFHGYESERLVTHRVLARREVDGRLHFQTQGDANAAPDASLAPAAGLRGRVALRLPAGGRVLTTLASPTGRLLLLALPATVLLAGELAPWLRPATRRLARTRLPGTRPGGGVLRPAPIAVTALLLLIAGSLRLATAGHTSGALYTTSGQVTDNAFATADPQSPANVSATFDCGSLGLGKGILVEWDAVEDIDGYEVARATSSGGPYDVLATVDATTTSYMDTEVDNSTTYYYVVRSTASSWTSPDSTEVSETTPSSTECLL